MSTLISLATGSMVRNFPAAMKLADNIQRYPVSPFVSGHASDSSSDGVCVSPVAVVESPLSCFPVLQVLLPQW